MKKIIAGIVIVVLVIGCLGKFLAKDNIRQNSRVNYYKNNDRIQFDFNSVKPGVSFIIEKNDSGMITKNIGGDVIYFVSAKD